MHILWYSIFNFIIYGFNFLLSLGGKREEIKLSKVTETRVYTEGETPDEVTDALVVGKTSSSKLRMSAIQFDLSKIIDIQNDKVC